MTRNEAFELAKQIGNTNPWYEDTIRLLEKLGLIKFDEEKQIPSPGWIIKQHLDNYDQPMLHANKIVDALYGAGYIIARKGD